MDYMAIPNWKMAKLPNGIRVVTESISEMRSVAMGIIASVGSGHETDDIAGISHFVEHMAFKGTNKRSAFQIASELDAVGGKMNAFTSKELTCYYAVVLDKHLNVAADVLTDIYLNSVHDPKEMELEKGVIVEEIKMYEDTPDELVHDLFTEVIYHGHSLGRPTIGSEKTVRAINRQDMKAYMDKFYTPENTIISIAGNISHEDALRQVEPFFSKMPIKHKTMALSVPSIIKGSKLKHKKTEQVHLCLGTSGPSQNDEDRYAFSILDTIVGSSMSSRLFQEVREKRGLAYSIYSYNAALRDTGLFIVYAGTSKETYKQVIDLVLAEFNKVKKEGLTKEEISRAKEHTKGSLVLGLESTSSRMNWLAKSEFYYGRILTIDEIFDKIDKVSSDDIIAVANKYIKEKDLTLTVIGDIKESEMPKV
jgi:predicted Zn-dependent peptidase